MGVTIHYYGKINELSRIITLTEELTEISTELSWKYHLIDDEKKQVKGIVIIPPKECEFLPFLFDSTGTLKSVVVLTNIDFPEDLINFISVKTQFADIEVHITIIKLLKYLKNKYINELTVFDEGEYWETEDRIILKNKIDFIKGKINELTGKLKEIQINENETPESIADKIEVILLKLMNRNK